MVTFGRAGVSVRFRRRGPRDWVPAPHHPHHAERMPAALVRYGLARATNGSRPCITSSRFCSNHPAVSARCDGSPIDSRSAPLSHTKTQHRHRIKSRHMPEGPGWGKTTKKHTTNATGRVSATLRKQHTPSRLAPPTLLVTCVLHPLKKYMAWRSLRCYLDAGLRGSPPYLWSRLSTSHNTRVSTFTRALHHTST